MPEAPHVGLHEVDRLIEAAAEQQWVFPTGVKRWALLAWAAEALQAKRDDPTSFARGEFGAITERHFPGSTKSPPA